MMIACTSPTSNDIPWTPKDSLAIDRPQKQASTKPDMSTFDSGVLVITQLIDGPLIDNENYCHCVHVIMASFKKSDHNV